MNNYLLGKDWFIGSKLAERLENLSVFEWDFLKDQFDLKGIDYVFHYISTTVPFWSFAEKDIYENLLNTIRLLNACVLNKVKKIIFPSSGWSLCEEPKSSHAIIKRTIEDFLKYYQRQYWLDYLILRYTNVYGYNERQNIWLINNMIRCALHWDIFLQYWDLKKNYIYIDDAIDETIKNLDRKNETILIGGQTYRASEIEKIINKNYWNIRIEHLEPSKFDVEYFWPEFITNTTIENGIKKIANRYIG